MLQKAYFLAKIGADTAENEQHFAEICQKLAAASPTLAETLDYWTSGRSSREILELKLIELIRRYRHFGSLRLMRCPGFSVSRPSLCVSAPCTSGFISVSQAAVG